MKKESIQSVCKKAWITKDQRLVFQFGKAYTHNKSEELSLKGENGIVMWMDKTKYHEHFEEANSI